MATRFDELSKVIARGLTRRQTFALIGGTFAVGVLGPFGVRNASAAPGCGRACQDAGYRPGSADFVACVHRCGDAVTTCEANALEACVSVDPVAATVNVTCCGALGTCNTVGVCVCPETAVPCAGLVGDVPTTTCCTGVQVCDVEAGVCVG